MRGGGDHLYLGQPAGRKDFESCKKRNKTQQASHKTRKKLSVAPSPADYPEAQGAKKITTILTRTCPMVPFITRYHETQTFMH
jgi:hypothetical protein